MSHKNRKTMYVLVIVFGIDKTTGHMIDLSRVWKRTFENIQHMKNQKISGHE